MIAVRVVRDRTSQLRTRLRRPTKRLGATHRELDLQGSLAYIDEVYGDFLRYADIGTAQIDGSRVLELGPGDNFGIPLRFLADGATHVTTMDRFIAWRDEAQQARIYNAMLERMSTEQRERAALAITSRSPLRFDPKLLRVIEGVGAENADRSLPPHSFDLIVSRAVLEHVWDLDAAFGAMDAVLAPGGVMAHKVDFRDHGLFTKGGHHPLTFLTIPDRVYGWMGDHSGLPNRRLIDYYRGKLAELGYDSRLHVTAVVGRGEELSPHPERVPESELQRIGPGIEQVRSKLRPRYRELPLSDIATAGIFLIARKPH